MRKGTALFTIMGLLVLVIGVAPGAPPVSADSGNLVGNPGFESPLAPGVTVPNTVGNWAPIHAGATQGAVPAPAHSGTQSASTQASAGGGGAFFLQDFPNFPFPSSYNLSFWIYPQQGTQSLGFETGWDRGTGNLTGAVGLAISPTGGSFVDWGASVPIPALTYSQWHQVSIVEDACTQVHHLSFDGQVVATTATTVPTPQLGSILFGETSGTATQTSQFYWDDFSLQTIPCPAADTSAPTTTASLAGTAGSNGWYTGPVTVTLAATDPDGKADVAATTYAIDGGATQTYAAPFTVSGDGAHHVTFSSVDKAGNRENPAPSLDLKIDSVAPTIVGTRTPAANSNGWNNTAVTVSFACADTGGSVIAACTAPVTLSTEGANQQAVGTATDVAGNSAAATLTGISIDTTKPTTTATPDRAANGSGWYAAPVAVTLSGTDTLSGIAQTTYRIDGGAAILYSAPFTVSGDGTHTLSYSSMDKGGNVEDAKTLTVKIDATAPTIAATATPGSIWPPNHKMVDVSVTVRAGDGGAGIAGVRLVSVTSSEPDNGLGDGDTANDIQGWATGPVTLNADGSATIGGQLRAERSGTGPGRVYTITIQVTDRAGNSSTGTATVSVAHNQ